jgi:hypothetical protein
LDKAAAPESPSGLPFDPTGQKPTAVTLLGVHHTVASWRDVLVIVCASLVQKHGDAFETIGVQGLGPKQRYLSRLPDAMATPLMVPGTPYYVDTTQNAKSIVRLVYHLLTSLGHPMDALTIELAGK